MHKSKLNFNYIEKGGSKKGKHCVYSPAILLVILSQWGKS